MADKKTEKSDKKKPNFLVRWWRETTGELRKVTWPTTQEALRLTRIVILVVLLMSGLLGLLDFLFSRIVAVVFA